MSDLKHIQPKEKQIRIVVQPLSAGLISRGPLTEEERAVKDRLFGRSK